MNSRPLISSGLLLGIGMGGFVDGILLHQLLQTHNMLTAVLPKTDLVSAEVNMFWDGLFHAFTWLTTAIGLFLLWKAGTNRVVPWSGRTLFGSMLMGWGLFNLVEGLIDHHILGIHHVIEQFGLSMYDYAFLASGVVLGGIGWSLIRSGRQDTVETSPSPALHRVR